MDLDYVLTFLVVASAIASGRAALKNRAWRWLGVQAANLTVLAAAWLFARGHVAIVAGPVWGLTVLAPGLATTLADRYARAERFGVALALSRVAALLHPSATTKLRVRVAQVQRLEVEGRLEEARALLVELAKDPASSVLAALLELRLEQRWQDARELIFGKLSHDKDPVAASFYLRALGEIGDVEALLATYEAMPRSPALATVEGQLMLFAAAFGGREETTAQVLRAHHAEMPDDGRRLWQLTAAHAAGKDVRADLEELARTGRARVSAVARARLSQASPAPLSPAAVKILDELARQAALLEPARPARPTACAAIALMNLYVFAREVPGGPTSATNLQRLGALYTGDLEPGEWYRLATAALLHYGPLHVGMNVLGLLVLGPRLEAAIGRARFVAIYVLSGFAANALAVVWTRHCGGQAALLVGASGAVMGVVGALLVRRVLRWRQRRTLLARREMISLVGMFALQIGFDAVTPRVAGEVHLFGAGIGALLAFVIARPRAAAPAAAAGSDRRAKIATAAALLAAVGAVELGLRAAGRDHIWSGECEEGDVASCAEDCAAELGADVLDAGAALTAPRFAGERGRYMLQSCNRYAYAVSSAPGTTLADKRRALAIYAATCDAGMKNGCLNEGVMLFHGEGAPADRERALRLFARACDAGEPKACEYGRDTLGGLERTMGCDAGHAGSCE